MKAKEVLAYVAPCVKSVTQSDIQNNDLGYPFLERYTAIVIKSYPEDPIVEDLLRRLRP